MKASAHLLSVFIIAVQFFASCDSSQTLNELPLTNPINAVPSELARMNMDEQFADMARNIEGFGGLFLDDFGVLNIYLKDPATQLDQALTTIPSKYNEVIGSEFASKTFSMEVHKGEYDFLELKGWKDAILNILSLKGLSSLDIDETKNLLVIGVEEASINAERGSIIEFIKGFDVPIEAVEIVVEEKSKSRTGLANVEEFLPTDQLYEHIRPMKGGLQIQYQYGNCTLGFHAQRTSTGKYGLVTNSHCSDSQGSVTGENYHQNNVSQSSEKIADETVDPYYWFTGACSGGAKQEQVPTCPCDRVCRQSDALFAEYTTSISWGRRYTIRKNSPNSKF